MPGRSELLPCDWLTRNLCFGENYILPNKVASECTSALLPSSVSELFESKKFYNSLIHKKKERKLLFEGSSVKRTHSVRSIPERLLREVTVSAESDRTLASNEDSDNCFLLHFHCLIILRACPFFFCSDQNCALHLSALE